MTQSEKPTSTSPQKAQTKSGAGQAVVKNLVDGLMKIEPSKWDKALRQTQEQEKLPPEIHPQENGQNAS